MRNADELAKEGATSDEIINRKCTKPSLAFLYNQIEDFVTIEANKKFKKKRLSCKIDKAMWPKVDNKNNLGIVIGLPRHSCRFRFSNSKVVSCNHTLVY